MKKQILLLVFFIILDSCSKDSDPEPEPIPYEPGGPTITEVLHECGLYPDSPEDIQYVGLIADSITYKLAGGRRNNHAWLSKFSPSGKELFSFELTNIDKPYSRIHTGSILLLDNNLMFIQSWTGKENDYNGKPIMSVINFADGKEISRIIGTSDNYDFKVTKNDIGYLVVETNVPNLNRISFINPNGESAWLRECTESEFKEGMSVYKDYVFLDAEQIIFSSKKDSYQYNSYKVINLKEYTLIFEILQSDIPFTGDNSGQKDIVYKQDRIYKENNNIFITYTEQRQTKIIDDQITGSFHYEYEVLGRYYYELNSNTGAVLNQGKFQ